ncbi:Cytochrome c551 peroxidase [BD1-7 clade bacterium]|uniref:Cytochrome c551 peroxidase n=1 Tax=BD1-7 clade bacterium TaxID=2029982 RepID=A0A5S9PK28_9GAMM|nr:Cytochrome c551 peroxidase [BD1-7 clade bacterium]
MRYTPYLLLCCAILTGCGGDSGYDNVENLIGSLPEDVEHPADNPSTPEKVELGRMLFWDPALSSNQDVACVTCHHPVNGYAENIDLSLGVGG